MISVLYVIGVIFLIISIIVGILSGHILGFLIALGSGISSAIIFFALAKILENQELIVFKLEYNEKCMQNLLPAQPMVECQKCNYKYENEYASCPHCGYRRQI